MSELAEALSFPLKVTSTTGKISGSFLTPENTFELDMDAQTLFIQGEKVPFPTKGIKASHHDIYATPEILQDWLPVELNFIYAEQRLDITTHNELPYQSYAKRRGIWQQLKEKQPATEIDAPLKALERKIISKPSLYAALNTRISRNSDDEVTNNNKLNLQASANVLQMAGHLSANITHQNDSKAEIKNVKATLTKLDPTKQMLGPLNASQIELGDINFQTQPLLTASNAGRGIFVSNKPINAVRDPDNFNITGNAPAGWDVEIYQNGLLLNFQTVAADGRYNFTDIPLQTGNNVFDIKIFGPNGERRQFQEEFYLGQGTLKKGEFNYDFIATESSGALIENKETENKNDGIVSLNTEYGISKNFSVLAGLYNGTLNSADNKETAYTLGMRTALFGTDLQTDYINHSNNASAYQFKARKKLLKNTDLGFSYRQNLNDEPTEDQVESSKSFSINQLFKFEGLSAVQARAEWENEQLLSGISQNKLTTRLGTTIFGMSITNDLEAIYQEKSDIENYTGTLSMSGRLDEFDIRGRADYRLKNNAGISQINARINGKLFNSVNAAASMTQRFEDGANLALYDTSFSWKLPKADFGFTLGGDTQGEVYAGINIASYYMPAGKNYTSQNSAQGSYGDVQINVRAFLDDNENDIYDNDEKLLENVVFHYNKRGHIARTDNQGIATLLRLNPFSENLISVDTLSLPDIYIKPVHEFMNVMGRPYQYGTVDFPLRIEGKATGSITYHENGAVRPLSGITLQAINSKGESVAQTVSEVDGYYTFTSIPMGTFTLNLSQEDLDTLGENLNVEKPESFSLKSTLPFVDGLNIDILNGATNPEIIIDNSLNDMVNEEASPTNIIQQSPQPQN
tara:strand:+ start:28369 stop:30945 length:2577 start_codon:yes stop_codon:yes gene_type:complete